jgi:hypothetical protein
MFVLICNIEGNYGGNYEDSTEHETLADVVDYIDKGGKMFYALYEVKCELFVKDLNEVREARASFDKLIRAQALAKLTAEERKALGL